jgi:hypothetical protein
MRIRPLDNTKKGSEEEDMVNSPSHYTLQDED